MKVVKSKKSSKLKTKADKKFREYVAEMEKKGRWARRIYNRQDQKTKLAIDEMIESMSQMSGRFGKVKFDNGEIVNVEVPEEVLEDGWLWVAIRLCIVAYEWDIRLANFNPGRL